LDVIGRNHRAHHGWKRLYSELILNVFVREDVRCGKINLAPSQTFHAFF
jgi:hypothetical protein